MNHSVSVICLLLSLLSGCLTAAPVAAQTTVWGLQRNDQFSVETTIEKETTIQLGDAPATTSKSVEKIVLQYSVISALPTETVLQVRIANASHKAGNGEAESERSYATQLQQLARIRLAVAVDATGVVRKIHGYEEALERLAGVDERTLMLLKQTVPEKCFATWVGLPFWMTPPDMQVSEEVSWERIGEISLGLFGSVRTIATQTVNERNDNRVGVSISGNSRHIPPVTPDEGLTSTMTFQDVNIKIDSFEGTGEAVFGDISDDETPPESPPNSSDRRPWFESMNLQWQISGQAVVQSGQDARTLTFAQTQKQSSRLMPGYLMGGPAGFPRFRLPPGR